MGPADLRAGFTGPSPTPCYTSPPDTSLLIYRFASASRNPHYFPQRRDRSCPPDTLITNHRGNDRSAPPPGIPSRRAAEEGEPEGEPKRWGEEPDRAAAPGPDYRPGTGTPGSRGGPPAYQRGPAPAGEYLTSSD